MLPLKQQACRGRDVIFYDQAGCGASVPDNNSSFLTASIDEINGTYPWLIDPLYYATEELPALIEHLGYEQYHILGSSWGTILAQWFMLENEPNVTAGAQSLVLSGPLSDGQLYINSQWDQRIGSLGSLPPYLQSQIHAMEEAGAYSSPLYQQIADTLTSFFTVRMIPRPTCWDDTLAGFNDAIYTALQGPSEFTVGGALQYFNTTPQLNEINLPVMLSSGKYDTMRPPVLDAIEKELPIVERVMYDKSGHCSMIDQPGEMNDAIADFLNRVEAAIVGGRAFQPVNAVAGSEGDVSIGAEHVNVPHYHYLPYVMTILAFLVGIFAGRSCLRRKDGYRSINDIDVGSF